MLERGQRSSLHLHGARATVHCAWSRRHRGRPTAGEDRRGHQNLSESESHHSSLPVRWQDRSACAVVSQKSSRLRGNLSVASAIGSADGFLPKEDAMMKWTILALL